MPELPEVEATRLSFADRIADARIEAVTLGKPLRWPLGCTPLELQGKRVLQVRRRGKYLLLDLSEGLLLIHLGMSGSLSFGWHLPEPGVHDHFSMATSQGLLRLNDPRRFGSVVYASTEADPVARKLLAKLGTEPLGNDFDAGEFCRAMGKRTAAIKQVLLAGDVVVGVGNIYACEVLFRAGIRPTRRACDVSRRRLEKLHLMIREVLGRAVLAGGTTLRDFSNAQGQAGHFQAQTMVYGRAEQPCRVCQTSIRSLRQGQRSTFFCPACQRH